MTLTMCNLHCSYCFNRHKPFNFLSKPKLDLILSEIKKINKEMEITVMGGEPTLYKYLDYIIDELYKINNVRSINVYTNGTINLNKFHFNEKVLISFSYHEHQHNKQSIINNQKYLDSINVKYLTNIMMEENIDISDFKGFLKPVYIIQNGKTQYVNHILSNKDYVMIDNKKYSFKEFERLKKNFKGYECYNREFHVNLDLTFNHSCFENQDIRKMSKYINLFNELICPFNKCNCFNNINIRKKD